MTTESYSQLMTALREISVLGSTASLLHWDQETNMPPKGGEHRANQISLIARLTHEQFTSPRIGEMLGEVEGSDLVADPESDAAANARETRRSYDRATKLPASLVEEIARTTALGQQAWVEARKKSEFVLFEPWLTKILELRKQEANCVGFQGSMYNALLYEYEPGETAENLTTLFDELRPALVDLVGRIAGSGRRAPGGERGVRARRGIVG